MSVFLLQAAQWILAGCIYWTVASNSETQLRVLKAIAFGFNIVVISFLVSAFSPLGLPYGLSHRWYFYALSLLVGIVLALIGAVLCRLVAKCPNKTAANRWWSVALWALFGGLIIGVAAIAFFIPHWFNSFFGELSADQLVFLLTSGNGESTAETDAQVNNLMVVPIIMMIAVGLQLPLWFPTLGRRIIALCGAIIVAVGSTVYAFNVLPLKDLSTMNSESEFLAQNYVDPDGLVQFPQKKRNLLHIYLESVENSYYDRAHGGYDERNYMPELLRLNQNSVHFSHTDKMGGPHQTFGSVHSAAAMINMEAGVPMKTSIAGGTADDMYYPAFPTIGEMLKKQGYNNELMMGANSGWGGLGDYYQQHGDFLVFDHPYAIEHGYLPEGYKQWWGYEDDKIYEFAKKELTRLAGEDKPFYFILENADTHFPDGYKSSKMTQEPFDTQYGNVIFYSQAEVAKFVYWVQEQPWGDDTTIVIVGDHRSMDKPFFEGWDKDYERTIVNMIINPAIAEPPRDRMYNRDFAPFDLFPTTLAAIGARIPGERAGLGTNLFSQKQTLVEEHGLDQVNDALAKRSEFYFNFHQ